MFTRFPSVAPSTPAFHPTSRMCSVLQRGCRIKQDPRLLPQLRWSPLRVAWLTSVPRSPGPCPAIWDDAAVAPVLEAARRCDLLAVHGALSLGFPVNVAYKGCNLLHAALEADSMYIASLGLARGARVEDVSSEGEGEGDVPPLLYSATLAGKD